MAPDSFEETAPNTGSPALSMKAAPPWLRTNENPLENADRCAGWRPLIIESAGEPVFGAVSFELSGALHPIASTARRGVTAADVSETRGFFPLRREARNSSGIHMLF